jgi:hypothetical protein
MNKAVYELEPIGVDGELEANGFIMWACSDECAGILKHQLEAEGSTASIGDNNDALPESRCEHCGKRMGV